MPNLFGMQKKNPLAALLMQPDLKSVLMQQQAQQQDAPQGPTLEQLGADLKSPAVTGQQPPVQQPQAPFKMPFVVPPSAPYLPPSPRASKAAGGALQKASDTASSAVGTVFGPKGVLTEALGGSLEKPSAAPVVNAPPKAEEFVGPPAPEGPALAPGFDEAFSEPLTTDEKEKNLDLGMGGGLMGGALSATQDILQKYGKMAQSAEGAKVALRNEFQDTPELDEIIAKTEADLAFTRDNKKQPGVGEFIALALMNLANHDYKNNAYMILGTGEQQAKEQKLEDRLADLQGTRAAARIKGRQSLQKMQQESKFKNLEYMLKNSEMKQDQQNKDRDFGLRKQGQDSSLLRALAGQEAEVMKSTMNPDTLKAATGSRDKLKKALGVDDETLDAILRQRQQQAVPKDDRQSRMFGDLMGGGGYA